MAKVQEESKWYDRIAWGVIIPVVLLSFVSFYAIYNASVNDSSYGTPTKTVAMQIVWYAISWVMVAFIMRFDAEQIFKLAPYLYGAGIFLLVAVLFLYDRTTAASSGAKSWFVVGPVSFQPSEVMKPAFILQLARVVREHNERYAHNLRNDWLLIGKVLAWFLPVAILLMLQPDFGTTLVFVAITAGILLVSGISWKIIIPVFLLLVIVGACAILLVFTSEGQTILKHYFKTYQLERIKSWSDPSSDNSDSAYQLWQSMKAIGSGQIFGNGLNNIKVYVPVRNSDMIFSVIGETLGFVGGVGLIGIYLILIIQMVKITFSTRNAFYSYVSTGIIMMILFHVFENIGMSIDLLPLTGVPLPFVSQGGSALIGNMIGIGLIMSMKWHNKDYMFSTSGDF
ncbi:Rod-shape determining protein [Lactobacillus equicursoris DSM 19284 = JCM 14600 = CIP 110162]|uniref:Rod-shape determining protein n=3 Tax=Lactobacillus equicursoris TaxID=420645 RepID=K0NU76_9LACO|nr:FtsW/RodA/SpoVE family cell cycle protein [Lactobacillus equicursoris]KRL03739.1 rod-shape determining protein [Lactobacillus equicursoris DSM 19284 = JCM 14600 = CIP 110162]MDD6387070.1 FtsW/RodA/SpoVE family cell cycle protein [Lactobacillus equicursoris]MST79452.1 rod shape-determining protein RodA [Lactobacillus equicursoris]CCK86004.1 Rod-shape determining protein [Lactobacillus equicursoris DSM 19284 = JCM 14600 = CIP 110162]